MTVYTVTITKHEEHPQWFRMTIVSWRNSIGESSIELLVTADTLRMMRLQIDNAVGKPPTDDELLPIQKVK